MNEKEALKKLLKIAQKQQAIIEKLAQFVPTGLKGDPLDPTLPGDAGAKTAPQAAKPPMPAPAANALPPDVKSGLDASTPHLRGSLNVKVDGKTVSVGYNADRIKQHATEVKNSLQRALPGYQVLDPIGYSNPNWHPNY
jgi:hypothetical protein